MFKRLDAWLIVLLVGLIVFSSQYASTQNLPLSGLPSAGAVAGTDLYYSVQSPGVGGVKVTASQISQFLTGNVKVRSSSASTVTAASATDYFLCLDPTSNAITVNLPALPTTGLTFLVKDCTGQANAHNITITPASGNIDNASTFVMSTKLQSVAVTYTGSQWSIN